MGQNDFLMKMHPLLFISHLNLEVKYENDQV